MKTKIIYISGSEIFDMNDIRMAFEEVRHALNLDKNTVLFGVPVDSEDAGLSAQTDELSENNTTYETLETFEQEMPQTEIINTENTEPEIIPEPISESSENESIVAEKPTKKRNRHHKEEIVEEINEIEESENTSEIIVQEEDVSAVESDEKVVPILSVLSTNEEIIEPVKDTTDTEIIPEIPEEIMDETIVEQNNSENAEEEADLEKLLSEMTPLDVSEDQEKEISVDATKEEDDDISVDATLEQLATEFAENQDKIASGTKSSSRNRIGKLRNILPFKQSKHKDAGLGDLFGWAGIAANDEDFSVPGFFTNATSRK